MVITHNEEAVSATFAYTQDCGGAPVRINYPRKVPTLALGEWGRILYNGRFSSDEGNWRYQKVVFNIGYFDALKSNTFLATID